jgi:hypothetical protein
MRLRALAVALGAISVAIVSAAFAAGASAKTVWLCKPGQKPDPCTPGLSTTVYSPTLRKLRVEHPKPVAHPRIDCFYVYPTVSDEKTGNSDLTIQDTERSIALYQASRYSQYCNVYAPMYRQVTLGGAGLNGSSSSTKANPALGLMDVENAFADYLRHYNHGRGFVLIGHSQGSAVLEALIAQKIDNNPSVRKRLVSAILMGGNVLVRGNSGIGGDFQHIPACRSATQLGCVIAFSTFDRPVPSDSLFGRPTSLPGEPQPKPSDQVLCTNPANLAGGSGLLDVIQPSAPFAPGSSISLGIRLLNWTVPSPSTVYWASPGEYSAQCEVSNGAHVLEISSHDGSQMPSPAPTPEFGLHLLDANIALGNLISIVRAESSAFRSSGR